jgi:hypothetical protein
MGCPGCPLAPPKGLGVRAPKRKKSMSPANGIEIRVAIDCVAFAGLRDLRAGRGGWEGAGAGAVGKNA